MAGVADVGYDWKGWEEYGKMKEMVCFECLLMSVWLLKCHFSVILVSFWCHFGHCFCPFSVCFCHFGVILVSFGCHFSVILVSLWSLFLSF